jgi:hypothetical protein
MTLEREYVLRDLLLRGQVPFVVTLQVGRAREAPQTAVHRATMRQWWVRRSLAILNF